MVLVQLARYAAMNLPLCSLRLNSLTTRTASPVYESLGKPDCNSTFGYQCLPWQKLTDSCNSWRIDKDIMDTFYLPGHSGVRNIIEHLGEANGTLSKWQRPGAFNDPDMILIGEFFCGRYGDSP